MSLALDARQRAMLQEMGVTVFTAPASDPATAPAAAPAATTPPAAQPAAPALRHPAPAAAPAAIPPTPAARPAAAPPAGAAQTEAEPHPGGLLLHPPVALYPQADAAATPPELGGNWLVLLESPTPHDPLAGDMGRLLDNMLRAMRLHLHPGCMAAALQRPVPGAPGVPAGDGQGQALAQLLATLRPAMVLLLGLNTARALLGGTASLAQLRASAHTLPGGTPAVVSQDPAHLLRAAHAKPAAWADLCRALALVRAQTGAQTGI